MKTKKILFDTCSLDHSKDGSINSDTFNALNELKNLAFKESFDKGWHHEEEDKDGAINNFGNYIANLHSEVSELWEAWRKGKLNSFCDKAEQMRMNDIEPLTYAEEEIADVVIRALDTAARLNVDVGKAVYYKLLFNRTREHRHGGKLA